MFNGLISLPWWGYILIVLGVTHITIASVTIYLHRYQAHHALELHPLISHFFRFWLWLTTAMGTKEWVAVHRKHHAKVDTEDDPHSPVIHGINKVLWDGVELYRRETKKHGTLDRYGHETPDDWIERNLYSKFTFLGVVCLLFINFSLFGVLGVSIWAIQMIWIPFFAAGVINGVGHWYGYRNLSLLMHQPILSLWVSLSAAKSCIITTMPLPARQSFLINAGSLILAGNIFEC